MDRIYDDSPSARIDCLIPIWKQPSDGRLHMAASREKEPPSHSHPHTAVSRGIKCLSDTYLETAVWWPPRLPENFLHIAGQNVRRTRGSSPEISSTRRSFLAENDKLKCQVKCWCLVRHFVLFSSLDNLTRDPEALRRTFSKFAGHVRCDRRISGSLAAATRLPHGIYYSPFPNLSLNTEYRKTFPWLGNRE